MKKFLATRWRQNFQITVQSRTKVIRVENNGELGSDSFRPDEKIDFNFRRVFRTETLSNKTIVDIDRFILRQRRRWTAVIRESGREHSLQPRDLTSDVVDYLGGLRHFDILLRRKENAVNRQFRPHFQMTSRHVRFGDKIIDMKDPLGLNKDDENSDRFDRHINETDHLHDKPVDKSSDSDSTDSDSTDSDSTDSDSSDQD